MIEFQVGDKVTFTDTVVKTQNNGLTTYEPAGLPCFLTWDGRISSQFDTGWIVRKRVLQSYRTHTEVEYGEYGYEHGSYQVTEPVKNSARLAYEVAWHINRRPVLVLVESLRAYNGVS